MAPLILYFSLAVCVSFLCSILEAVLLSVSHGHIQLLLDEKNRAAPLLRDLKERIDQPLSAILTLNTVANTVGAAGVGAQALHLFGSRWVAFFSALLTFAILIFSEFIPKTLGVLYWKRLAPPAAYLIKGLIILTYPMVLFFRLLTRFIGKRGLSESKVTREEMIALAGLGEDEGTLGKKEKRIIENLLRLEHVRCSEVMTPRSVFQAFQEDRTVSEIVGKHAPIRFSRIPVFGKDLDDIKGVVFLGRIMESLAGGEPDRRIGDLVVPVFAVPENQPVARTLDEFIARREHLFLVLDEYGGTEGIVTLEDAIETLLGVEIVDELDSVEDMQKHALERFEKKKRKMNL